MEEEPIIISCSQMRNNMQESLRELTIENWHTRAYWPDGKTKQSYCEYLIKSVGNTFYESLTLDEWEKAKSAVEYVFFTEEEAKKVHEFASWFYEGVYDAVDYGVPDEEVEFHPDWPEVRRRAREIYEYLKENDKKYHIEESWKLDGIY